MSKQYYIVYETKNLKNGKIYVGMHETNNLEDGYLGSGKHLKRAIRYYGKEYFERRILFYLDSREEMINKEIELVNEEFINRDDTYNIMAGGHGGFISDEVQFKRSSAAGKKHANRLKNDPEYSIEFKLKMSESIKKTYLSGRKGKNNFSWKGKKRSEETKRKMRASSKGQNIGNTNAKGGVWVYNLKMKKSKRINNEKLLEYLNNGWIKGRKMKF